MALASLTRAPALPAATSDGTSEDVEAARRPRWARPTLLAILAATAVLYLVNLSSSGYGNDFYAAAVQAGTHSWKAFFFGSFDSANAITVDKPPASLWVMELSARVFGLNSWSLLVPQALEGVAAVALLHATVRRVAGHGAALVAAAAFAVTPVAVLMFRFDNPDAGLVLVLVAAAYAATRALESASTRWLLLAGGLVGLGFITKMGQALLVVPGLGLAYLVAAPASFRRRVLQLLAAGLAMVAGAGWWVAAVALTPAADRPFVGGSTDNSVLGLAFGYNGASRLFGGGGNRGTTAAATFTGRGGGGGGGGGGGPFGGGTGIGRLFGSSMETQISWLLPAALVALVLGLAVTMRARWTDRTRAALLLWGVWLGVSGLVFSFAQGTIHPYYTVAIAPAVAALLGIGGHLLWVRRSTWPARAGLAAMVAVTAVWDVHLLGTDAAYHPWLRWVVGTAGVVAVLALLAAGRVRARAALVVALVAALGTGLTGTSAWALETVSVGHSGSQPTAGPTAATGGRGGFGGGRAGAGGGTQTADASLTAALRATTTRWSSATVGAQTAGPLELASGTAILAVGGFSGSDPSPTLAQFEAIVAKGQIRYFLAGGGFGGGRGGGGGRGTTRDSSAITSWVQAHYATVTIGGQTVYDLTQPTG